jgi:hypothetical protein
VTVKLIKLLAIYFLTLTVLTLAPAKVSSYPFINLARSIQFEVDPNSPVISVEKDFLESEDSAGILTKTANLNEIPAKKPILEQTIATQYQIESTKVQSSLAHPMIDYSKEVRLDILSQITVSGPLELKQGLALTDEHKIEIVREYKGNVVEYGDIDIEKGVYAIKLSNLEGNICARLHGSRYEIIGEGCFTLERIKNLNKSVTVGPLLSISRYKDVLAFSDKYREPPSPAPLETKQLPFKLKEQTQETDSPIMLARSAAPRPSAQSRVIDFYDSDKPEAEPLVTLIQNSVQNTEDSGSTIITRLSAPNHLPTRIIANNRTPARGASIPNSSAINSLRSLAEDSGSVSADAPRGVAWGRAMAEGRAVAGAQVEIEGRDDIRPVYLNEFYIPDVNQKSTASHGLFAFVGIADGEYSIRAMQNNKFMGFQNISVREGELAIADIDSTERRRSVRIAIYDLINKTSQDAVATLQNYQDDVVVSGGQADVNVQDNYDTAYAMVTPLDKKYLTAQYLLNAGDDLYNFPLIESRWIELILSQAKLQHPVRNKIVIGLGSQKPFRVEAIGSKTAQVIYFDSQGQVIEGNFGVSGGGFFILDPEDEVNEYAIQAAGEKSVRAVYMPTMPNVLNVIQL